MTTHLTHTDEPSGTSSRGTRRIAGIVVTTLVSLFLAFDALTHLLNLQAAQDWNEKYGAPDWFSYPLGIALTVSLVVHLVPRTAVLGAVLLTGYLGGAIAVNLFINDQAVVGSVFAFGVAVFVWLGLWLRDDRVKVLYS